MGSLSIRSTEVLQIVLGFKFVPKNQVTHTHSHTLQGCVLVQFPGSKISLNTVGFESIFQTTVALLIAS